MVCTPLPTLTLNAARAHVVGHAERVSRAVGRGVLGAAGFAAVVIGVLVLQSTNARGVGVDPFAGPPQDRDWLDTLCAWNGSREVGAALVVVGLMVLAVVVGVLLGGRPPTRRALVLSGVAAGLLLTVGTVVFAWPREHEVTYEGTYRLIRAPEPMPRMVLATMVWSRAQAVAALVVTTGLLLGGGVAGAAVGPCVSG